MMRYEDKAKSKSRFAKSNANVTSLLTSLCTKINDFSNPNQASSSSTLPSNTIPNPRNEARAITTRSGVSYEGPSIPMPPPFVNPDVVEETSTEHVPPPLTQKFQDTIHKHTKKISENWEILVDLKDALVEMPKFNKWLSTLLRNKDKLEEIVITTVNAECSAIIMNKVPKKLEDPGKFLFP
ncbi:hypothetical protein Tco_0536399 [Tanacetum coccineum]